MAVIESVLQESRLFPPPADLVKNATVSGDAAYQALCDEAERDYEGFWARLAREMVVWKKPFTQVLDASNAPFFKWFADGELNASYNCLDRHLPALANKVAIIFEADDGRVSKVTYQQLYNRVCKFANALKAQGIAKGDRVLIYMPMSIEAVVAMQACARIGATHSIIFGGFSADAVADRNNDAQAKIVVTADAGWRRGKEVLLKQAVDQSLEKSPSVQKVVVVNGNTEVLGMLESVLDAGRYDMVFVESSDHAYSQIKKLLPNLVILCTRIEELSAFQLLTMLKLDDETRDIPVLTYTTEYEGQDFDEAISQLADEDEEILSTRPAALRMN